VRSLNGKTFNNLAELVAAVDSCSEEFLAFELEYNQQLVLSTQHAKQVNKDILDTHCIASDRSPDLMAPKLPSGTGPGTGPPHTRRPRKGKRPLGRGQGVQDASVGGEGGGVEDAAASEGQTSSPRAGREKRKQQKQHGQHSEGREHLKQQDRGRNGARCCGPVK